MKKLSSIALHLYVFAFAGLMVAFLHRIAVALETVNALKRAELGPVVSRAIMTESGQYQ